MSPDKAEGGLPSGCQLAKLSDLSEGPGPTHLMPQLVTGHKAAKKWKRLNLGMQRLGEGPGMVLVVAIGAYSASTRSIPPDF